METPEGMRQFAAYHRRMLLVMGGVCLAILCILSAAMRQDQTWSAGFLAGAAAQLFKFAFIDYGTILKIAALRENAPAVQLKASFLSMFLFGAALAAVYFFQLNIWACAAGIIIPRIILIADTYIRPDPFGTPPAAENAAEEGSDG